MSSFKTHILIGAVGGLALPYILEALPGTWNTEGILAKMSMIIGSTILATWPDIDEPGSWPARRMQMILSMIGGSLGGFVVLCQLMLSPWWLVIGLLFGMLSGYIIGLLALRGLRVVFGGHRMLTHSLPVCLVLLVAAWGLSRTNQPVWAILPAALAWGQLLHLLGDVVTPAGVPLFAPLHSRNIRVLPEPFCRIGELIIAGVALIVGALLLGVVRLS